jgi:hypothetical protein
MQIDKIFPKYLWRLPIHEFTIAFEEGKPIGVLEGSWTMDEQIKDMIEKSDRPASHVIFDPDPKSLVAKIIKMVEEGRKDLNHK